MGAQLHQGMQTAPHKFVHTAVNCLHMSDFTEAMLGAWADAVPVAKALDAAGNIWHIDLPASQSDARLTLQQHSEALAQDQAAIEAAVERLKAFIDDYPGNDAGASKSLEATPETTLREQLESAGAQSKDLLDPLGDIRAEFDNFVQRVREFVSDFASIETAQSGVEIAKTKVGWTGDVQTLWRDGITPAQVELHRLNVRVALARRGMLMRLMVVISTSAAKIALRLATPGAQLLALPAIFQFIKDVVAEVRKMKKIQAT